MVASRFHPTFARAVAGLSIVLLGSAIASAEQARGRPAAGDGPAEVVRVRLAELTVLARDELGQPVTNLDSVDLAVRWRGQPIPFRLVPRDTPETAAAELPDVRLTVQIGADERSYTTTPRAPRYVLFFIDLGPDLRGRKVRSPEAVIRFAREVLQAGDHASVISYNGRLHHETQFESDLDKIDAALRNAYSRTRTPGLDTRQRIQSLITRMERCEDVMDGSIVLVDQDGRTFEPGSQSGNSTESFNVVPGTMDVDTACVQNLGESYIDQTEQESVRYLRSLGEAILYAGGLHERATVIAVTPGVTVAPGREFTEVARGMVGESFVGDLRSALDDGDRAGVVLHEVKDLARKQRVTLRFVDPARSQGGVRSARNQRLFLDSSGPYELAHSLPQGPLEDLADATAGVFVEARDLYEGLRQAWSIDRGRYTLLAYLPEEADDDGWNELNVKAIKPELRVTWNLGAASSSASEEDGASIVFGRAEPIEEGQALYVPFAIGARPAEMDYRTSVDGRVADLTLSLLVQTDEGSHLVSLHHLFRHTLDAERWDEHKDSMLSLRGWIEAPPGRYRISGALRNARSGRERSVVRDLRLEPL